MRVRRPAPGGKHPPAPSTARQGRGEKCYHIVAISFILTRALLIGEIPVPRKHSSEIVFWSVNPGHFIRAMLGWTFTTVNQMLDTYQSMTAPLSNYAVAKLGF
jgi:hypothetical protein